MSQLNLIVCMDGTWNDPNNKDGDDYAPTNVRKLFNAVDLTSSGVSQKTRYQSGVGTGGLVDKLIGGMVGAGISEDICDCYRWLCTHYKPGAKIFLFGFSRGAFAARSLGGMLARFGIAKIKTSKKQGELVSKIYRDGYRKQRNTEELKERVEVEFYSNSKNIEFIGVWDTVGALGVPDDKAILELFDNADKYRFHDVALSNKVKCGRHAVAIDERRGSFTPTLWDEKDETDQDRIKQLWFPGVHSDVGGGYRESGLSDGALQWMVEEAQAKGVVFVDSMIGEIKPHAGDILHDSHVGVMKALITAPRNIPSIDSEPHKFHSSVLLRRDQPPIKQGPYLATRRFNQSNEITLDIYAKHQWYWTGIFLEKGQEYEFTATGEWKDKSIPAGPGGTDDGDFHFSEIVHLAGSTMGAIEKGFKKLFGNENANFAITKRHEASDWMALMGATADSSNPNPDGTHDNLTIFDISEKKTLEAKSSGYLYCFANDAWGFYGNNRGFVTLTAKKL